MNLRSSRLVIAAVLLASAARANAQDKGTKEAADKLHAQALQEPDSGKAVKMLCQAAGMVPKNAEYQNDCANARRTVMDADQRNLNRALDASEAKKLDSAKRYAGMVTATDAKLYQQAQQLITKLNTPDQPAAPPAQPAGPSPSVALLAQAQKAFDSGNLSEARSAAQQVTDASIKPSASHLLSEIDSYTSAVSEGHHHEDAKEYAQAASAYQSALSLNPHVSSDDLAGRVQHMHQMASAPPPPAPTPVQAPAPVVVANNAPPKQNLPQPPKPQQPALSAQDKQRLLADGEAALARKDMNGAESKFKQVLVADPQNADAKRGMADLTAAITAELSRDPVLLENTLRTALRAFYSSDFETAEQDLNRYLGASGGKKKGAAYFYLGATDQALALLAAGSRRASRENQAKDNFKQARAAGYQPVPKYVSEKILDAVAASGHIAFSLLGRCRLLRTES